MGWQDDEVVGNWRDDPIVGDVPSPEPAAPQKGKLRHALEAGIVRPLAQGAAATVGIVSDPIAGAYNAAADYLGFGGPRMSSARDTVGQGLDVAGIDRPQGAFERVTTDITEAVGGAGLARGAATALGRALPAAAPGLVEFFSGAPARTDLAATAASSAASAVTREAGGGPLAQMVAGLAGGAFGGFAFSTRKTDPRIALSPRKADPGIDRLLADREGVLAEGTDEAVQAALRRDYNAAKQPFDAPYQELRETTVQPPAKIEYAYADIPSAAPIVTSQPRKAPTLTTDNTRGAMQAVQATLDVDPAARAALRGVGNPQPTIGHQMALISRVQDKAQAAFRQGAQARGAALSSVAEAMQQDLDDSISSLGNRVIDAAYKAEVIGPYKALRSTFRDDPSKTWTRLVGSTPEQIERTLGAVSPETRNVLRNRVLAAIIQRENLAEGASAGTGIPLLRQFQAKGLDRLFTPEEWRGVRAVANQLGWVKGLVGKSITLGGGASIGGAMAGPVGAVGGALIGSKLDDYLASPQGRILLAKAGSMSPRLLQEELAAVLLNRAAVTQTGAQASRPEVAEEAP